MPATVRGVHSGAAVPTSLTGAAAQLCSAHPHAQQFRTLDGG